MFRLEFDDSNGNGKSSWYKLEVICNSAINTIKWKWGQLLGFYYLVLLKGYLKKETTWEPTSAIQQLWKLITIFPKEYPDKPTITSSPVNTTPPMAKSIVKPIKKQDLSGKATGASKRAKKNWAFDFYLIFDLFLIVNKKFTFIIWLLNFPGFNLRFF